MNTSGVCPECDGEVRFPNRPALDQRTLCPYCGSDLAVIRIDPLVLDWGFVEPLSRPDRGEFLDALPYHMWGDH